MAKSRRNIKPYELVEGPLSEPRDEAFVVVDRILRRNGGIDRSVHQEQLAAAGLEGGDVVIAGVEQTGQLAQAILILRRIKLQGVDMRVARRHEANHWVRKDGQSKVLQRLRRIARRRT